VKDGQPRGDRYAVVAPRVRRSMSFNGSLPAIVSRSISPPPHDTVARRWTGAVARQILTPCCYGLRDGQAGRQPTNEDLATRGSNPPNPLREPARHE
jgi:hypothetical protein